jgi:hypothetical protein
MGRSGWIRRNGWVVAVSGLLAVLHLHALQNKDVTIRQAACRLEEMERDLLLAVAEQEDLELKIASQSDPAWIEMVLMRELGVVPEGWLKVHFAQ